MPVSNINISKEPKPRFSIRIAQKEKAKNKLGKEYEITQDVVVPEVYLGQELDTKDKVLTFSRDVLAGKTYFTYEDEPMEFTHTFKAYPNSWELVWIEDANTHENIWERSKPTNAMVGGKKITKEKVRVGKKEKTVYVGPRGGRYVKTNGSFIRIKS